MNRKATTIEVKHRLLYEDPQTGLLNLVGSIFYHTSQAHLIEKAIALLNFIREQKGLDEGDWKKLVVHESPLTLEINGVKFSYSNYQTILLHLRKVGMLRKEKGVYKLSRGFSDNLDAISDCWRRFLRRI